MTHPDVAPVVLLAGEEPLLQQEWLAALRRQLDVGPFDEQTFGAPEAEIADVLAAAQSAPLAARQRLIVLADAHRLPAAVVAHLVTYAHAPRASTCLVLLVAGDPPAATPWPALSAAARLVRCDAPQGPALRAWLAERAAALQKTLTPAAAALLEEQWGNDLLALANALAQAAAYVGARRSIDEPDVEILGGRNPQATVFQWTDLIVAGEASAALQLLALQQEEGKSAPELIGMLTWQFSRLLRAKRLQADGASEHHVLAAAGVKPSWRGAFLRQLHSYTLAQLREALELLWTADLKSKRGQVTPALTMTLAVVRLCGLRGGAGVSASRGRPAAW